MGSSLPVEAWIELLEFVGLLGDFLGCRECFCTLRGLCVFFRFIDWRRRYVRRTESARRAEVASVRCAVYAGRAVGTILLDPIDRRLLELKEGVWHDTCACSPAAISNTVNFRLLTVSNSRE